MANSLTTNGITWVFDKEITPGGLGGTYQYGQYANGDYWIVGPVTVTSMDPGWVADPGHGGAELNCIPDGNYQGVSEADFNESRAQTYSASRNAILNNLPLTIGTSSSLLSARGRGGCGTDGDANRTHNNGFAVLTVVSSPPASGSFRPGYAGTTKTIMGNKDTLRYDRLGRVTPVTGTPAFATSEHRFGNCRPNHLLSWYNSTLQPCEQANGYGSNNAAQLSEAILLLNCNYTATEKEHLLIDICQFGIDLYSIIKYKTPGAPLWLPNGGHGFHAKAAILFAGVILDNAEMMNMAAKTGDYLYDGGYGPGNLPPDYQPFAEDGQCFIVTSDDVSRGVGFTSGDIGEPWWGIRHSVSPSMDSGNIPYGNDAYMRITTPTWYGAMLGFLIMSSVGVNCRSLWNHGAIWDQMDKYWSVRTPLTNATNRSYATQWIMDMWNNYRSAYPPVWPTSTTDDTTPPLAPTSLISNTQTSTSIALSWTAAGQASDGDYPVGYRIYRDAALVTSVTGTTFTDTGLTASTSYDYAIYSYDDAGNESTTAATNTFSTTAAAPAGTLVFINGSGSSTNGGTSWSDALRYLPAILTRGTTYYIGAGSFGRYTFDDAANTTKITIKKATIADHGVDTGWTNAFADRATWGNLTFSSTSHIDFLGVSPDQTRIQHNGTSAELGTMYVSNSNNIRVTYCDMYGMNGGTGNMTDSIQRLSNSSYLWFENNRMHDIADDVISTSTLNHVYWRWNRIYNAYGIAQSGNGHSDAFELVNCDDCELIGNFVYGIQSNACVFMDNFTGATCDRLLIANNIFYNNADVWYPVYIAYTTDCKFYNNIIWGWKNGDSTTSGGIAIEGTNVRLDMRNNITPGIHNSNNGKTWDYNSTCDYNFIYGYCIPEAVGTNDIRSTLPKFTNIPADGYNLTPTVADFAPLDNTAPTIDVGTAIAEVSYDIQHNPRPAGSAEDIGAFEYSGVVSTGACCNPATGECTITTQNDCGYNWLGAGSSCADCITEIPTDGLILSYPCDETTGYITADASGNGSAGYLVNAASDFTGGDTMFSDGTILHTNKLDGVEFQSPNMKASRGAVSAAFYPTVVDGLTGDREYETRYIFGHAYDAWSNTIQIYIENGYLQLGMGSTHRLGLDIFPISANEWYHVVLTWQDSGITITDGVVTGTPTGSGTYSLYLDAVLVSSGTYSGLNQLRLWHTSTTNYMARFGNTGLEEAPVASEAFEGYLDNMRVYNLPLTAAEASALAYNEGKDVPPPAPTINPPTVTNAAATGITATEAIMAGEVTSTGGENPTVTIYYGTTDGAAVAGAWDSSIVVGARSSTFNLAVGGLSDDTTYYYRCYATNSGGYDWANSSETFNTLTVSAPTITQDAASNIGVTEADVSGNITDDGNDTPTVNVYYGLTDEGVVAASWDEMRSVTLSTDNSFIHTIQTLTANTVYYFRFAATNTGGTTWASATNTFTTNVTGAPTVINTPASNIGTTEATIGGEVTDVGLENPSVTIYWGKTNGGTTASAWDNTASFGVETGAFSTVLTQLDVKSIYYFRAYATNSYGSDWANSSQSFTTIETEPVSPDPNDKPDGFLWGKYDNAYEIATPYQEDEVAKVHRVSRGDVTYLAHTNHWPRKLTRYGDRDWKLEEIDFVGGPFLDDNTEDTQTVQYINGTGSTTGNYYNVDNTGTLQAVGHTPFLEQMVGGLWLVKHTRGDNSQDAQDNNTHATPTGAGVRIKGDWQFDVSNMSGGTPNYTAKIWRKEGNGGWQEFKHFSVATLASGTEENDDVYYNWTASNVAVEGVLTAQNQVNYGIVKITSFSSTTEVSVKVISPVYQESGASAATPMWAEGAWNDYRGFPESVTFYGDRLWWGSTTNNPQGLWGSKVGYYEDHTKGIAGDDAIVINIGDNDVSSIEWISATRNFMVGSARKEYLVSASDLKDPITPSDKYVRPHSAFGSMSIQPVEVEGGLLYAQRLGHKMLVLYYEYMNDSYDSADTNRIAPHMFKYRPVDISRQGSPETVIWVTREDGTLCCFRYNKDEEIMAWSRVITGGSIDSPTHAFISTAVVAGDTEDRVWVIVQRIIDGEFKYYIEKFSNRVFTTLTDSNYLDCTRTRTTDSTGKLSRLFYLEGHEVTIMQGATEIASETITDGQITGLLPNTEYTIGLPYLSRLRTMSFAVPGIVTEGNIKRVLRVILRSVETKGGTAGAESHGQDNEVDLDIPYSLDAADVEVFGEGGFTKDSRLVMEFNDPYPATVLALVFEVEIL